MLKEILLKRLELILVLSRMRLKIHTILILVKIDLDNEIIFGDGKPYLNQWTGNTRLNANF